ncbi:MAG TPA: hypothetical protein VLT33_15810 [Labilithrix sp.]|nr:hypothetical protein [Labilithrix sp.]
MRLAQQLRVVRNPPITIAAIPEGCDPAIIELVAFDEPSLRAVATLRGTDLVRLVPAPAWPYAAIGRSPAMTLAVADARRDGFTRSLLEARRAGALNVAVVGTASPPAPAELRALLRAYDAVLPVVVTPGADAEASLARAVALITAFATANTVSIPVDEAYPFFVRSGLLVCGAGEGDDLASAFARAVTDAAVGEGARRPLRTLLHIETTPSGLLGDLDLVGRLLTDAVGGGELWLTASTSEGARRRVSIVAACPSPLA